MHGKQSITVGAAIAAFLARCQVKAAFGVISIHNMPILDAFNEQGKIRFIPARGEAGAANMADAYARTTGSLGVCLTSTGTAAGNACGAMVEALTAGTPLLHITGQIEASYLDQDVGYIHEAPDQLTMLHAVSKAAFRIRTPQTALGIMRHAVKTALSAPGGPVSVEVPIDIQAALIPMPEDLEPWPVDRVIPPEAALDKLAQSLARAKRPMLWLGGGARHAGLAVQRLVDMGFCVVTSTQGRGIVAEDHPQSLGAYTLHQGVEDFYATCDAMLVVGSRLRSNETLTYKLKLPQPLYRIDAYPLAEGRCYDSAVFVCGDSALALAGLADRLAGRMQIDAQFTRDLRQVHRQAQAHLIDGLGNYAQLVTRLQAQVGRNFNWVRDVTLSNSIWGNRELRIFHPTAGVHALGGGIGQGLAMGIGAAIAAAEQNPSPQAAQRKTFCLVGDGGFILNLGEMATMVQERANMVLILMNDQGYGVIKNIQDTHYGARRCYVDLHTPDYAQLCASMRLPHTRISDLRDFEHALRTAIATEGPAMIEIDMLAIGSFKTVFAGPPVHAPLQHTQNALKESPMLHISLIGFGAIGQEVSGLLAHDDTLSISHVVVPQATLLKQQQAATELGLSLHFLSALNLQRDRPDFIVECAGHAAIEQHVMPALEAGIPCLIVSMGALSAPGMIERIEAAAHHGKTQVQLLPGAIGAIDALAAARIGGLEKVLYVGRKPPLAWQGTPAEAEFALAKIRVPTKIFQGSAREAAHRFPKNANVAATLAISGLGLDQTQVELYADPTLSENQHRVEASGAFGFFELTMRGKPLAANPKTSALTVYSVVRALTNRSHSLVI